MNDGNDTRDERKELGLFLKSKDTNTACDVVFIILK